MMSSARGRFPATAPSMFPLRLKIASLVTAAIAVFSVIFAYQTVKEIAARERSLAERARGVAKSTAQYALALELDPRSAPAAHVESFLALSTPLHANIAFLILTDRNDQFAHGEMNPAILPAGSHGEVQTRLAEIVAGRAELPTDLHMVSVAIETEDGQLLGGVRVGYSLRELRRELTERRRNLFLLAGGLLLVGVTASLYVARRITSPLEELAAAMQRVEQGDLSQRVQTRTSDEVGLLTDIFNSMTRGLRERERIKLTFARYVSRQVADKILANQEAVVLTGERRRASILFADIRGFTRLSARKSPEEVLNLLNEYFRQLIDVVFLYRGTLDKFIGDALMAVFNAPLELDHSELRAVAAGLAMQKAVTGLNAYRRQRGLEEVQIGIGISTGDVIAGNIGSEKRLEYTVIGAEVNLAERIEAHTRGGHVVVSGETYRAVAPYVEAERLAPVRLRGFDEPVELYRIVSLRSDVRLPDLTTL
jgi:class 3 adenylate cyclase